MGETKVKYHKYGNGEHYRVNELTPNDVFMGLRESIAYACDRFGVERVADLTDEQWAHATAEYMASLLSVQKDFRNFVTK